MKNKNDRYIIIVVVVLIITCMLMYFHFQNEDKKRFAQQSANDDSQEGVFSASQTPSQLELVDPKRKTIKVSVTSIFYEDAKIQALIKKIHKDNSLLYSIDPTDFEKIVAEILVKKNFEVELTPPTKDGGFDVVAYKDLEGFKNKYIVECKRYKKENPVGLSTVRSFCNVIQENNANKGIICTTSRFTKGAREKQEKQPHLLEFIDGKEVINWISDYVNRS